MQSRPHAPSSAQNTSPLVTAVLGPTNTGKTHLAVERMLAHGGGMIGLPLRLLAREIFDRVVAQTSPHLVALVTGEEKIIPAHPRYWIATVEAMPPDVTVPFLAIDECQLGADFARGAVFTDRILHRRGTAETMLLGAATLQPLLKSLLPHTQFISRPRLSRLSYGGVKKMSRLPRRSAIVAFSTDMVYATAELIRRQNGGAAVVMGALSPRTRNAQIALYQSGDVDYIVATDAIGMGLNMHVDHVAFASTRKFDGFQFRELNASELAQIAGRAGRFMRDGTFGCTGEVSGFDQEMIERLENHQFEPIRTLQWRNTQLDFTSLTSLHHCLNRLPGKQGLARAQPAADLMALEAFMREPEMMQRLSSPRLVECAWSVCQIPDYRNISPAEHAHLIMRIFNDLMSPQGHINEEWFAKQLKRCDTTEGDLDALSNRISHVRTWTYVANRANWLKAPLYWQRQTSDIEEKLSDALHNQLTQRFIDRRTSVLMRRLAQREELMSTIEENGMIHVEGEYVGRIEGFHFIPDGESQTTEQRTLKAAALQAVTQELQARAEAASASADPDLKLTREGQIIWNGHPIASLEAGDQLLKPRVRLDSSELISTTHKELARNRLQKFIDRHVATLLEPLIKLEENEQLQGLARGLAFRLVEHLGAIARDQVAEDVKALSQEERASLRGAGVRFGAFHIFIPALLKPAPTELRLLLWALQQKKAGKLASDSCPTPPGQGLTSAVFDRTTPVGFYATCGFRICGTRVVRIDMLERLADLIRERVFWRPRFPEEARPLGSVEGGGFTAVSDMMSLVGCSGEEFSGILRSLGFRMQKKWVKPQPIQEVKAIKAVLTQFETESVSEPELASPLAPQSNAATAIEQPLPATPTVSQEGQIMASPPPAVIEELAPPSVETSAETSEEPLLEMAEQPPMADGVATAPEIDVPPELSELQVWWPKDTGPFRHKLERSERTNSERTHKPAPLARADQSAPPDKGENSGKARYFKPNRSHTPQHEGTNSEANSRTESRERSDSAERSRRSNRKNRSELPRHSKTAQAPVSTKAIDPTSPFAVLMALKNKMAGES